MGASHMEPAKEKVVEMKTKKKSIENRATGAGTSRCRAIGSCRETTPSIARIMKNWARLSGPLGPKMNDLGAAFCQPESANRRSSSVDKLGSNCALRTSERRERSIMALLNEKNSYSCNSGKLPAVNIWHAPEPFAVRKKKVG